MVIFVTGTNREAYPSQETHRYHDREPRKHHSGLIRGGCVDGSVGLSR